MVEHVPSLPKVVKLPQFPGSAPAQLTRRQGVFYAERVLRQLDQEHAALAARVDALEWCIEEMRRVRDSVASTHGEEGAGFFEGVINRLHPARVNATGHLLKAEANRLSAKHCREKAHAEFDKLTAHAEMLEGSANKHEDHQLHDSRFA